ncbi:MAG: ATP-binding protein [Gammaproteobacteria bacterium]|nr:ATP-binding protein [Gammaproteobacteria bacterium]
MLQYKLTENRFESLVENIPGIIYQCALDEHWTMEYINHDVETITGYKASDFIGNSIRSYASIIHPDDVAIVDKVVAAAVNKKAPYSIEYRIIDSKGKTHWVYEKGRATYDEKGKPAWLDGVIFDVSVRKTLEKIESGSLYVLDKLARGAPLEDVLEAVVLSIQEIWPEMICSVLLLDNESGCLHLGAAPDLPDYYNEAIEGLKIGKNVGSCGAAAFTKTPCVVDDILTHPNWKPFIEIVSRTGLRACWSHPVISAEGIVLGTFACYYKNPRSPEDSEIEGIKRATNLAGIAIQRRAEEQALIKEKERAEEANKAKSDFLSRMSHELRTPLNAIMGFAQLFDLDEGLDEVYVEYSREIYNAGNHLLQLVNDILDLSKIEAGKMEVSSVSIDVASILTECYRFISPFAGTNSITMSINPVQENEFFVLADPLRLKQILLNLLNNAIKYNCKNGRVDINVANAKPGYIRISITDEGLGLDENQKSKLFTPFDRLGADKTKVDGAGIGLVISKNLANLMGGGLGVDSEEGNGSTFWLELKTA